MSGSTDERGTYDEHDQPDDATLWAGRLRAWPAAGVAGDAATDDGLDETRMAGRAAAPLDETIVRSRRTPTDVVADPIDDGTAIRPRRPAADPLPSIEHTEVRPTTRREASGRIAAPADTPRNASVPTGAAREIYRPRAAEPVIVSRAAMQRPPGAGGVPPDAAAARRRDRARRRRLAVVVVLAVVAVLAAVAGLVVILVL